MRFRILTLIDITQSGGRRTDGDFLFGQQSNYNTVIQTIGLRANPSNTSVDVEEQQLSKLDFGKSFKGKHKVWTFQFEIEYGGTQLEDLISDFDFVPIVTGLAETAKINTQAFRTSDPEFKNVIFEKID